jgi:hypothetical protein
MPDAAIGLLGAAKYESACLLLDLAAVERGLPTFVGGFSQKSSGDQTFSCRGMGFGLGM